MYWFQVPAILTGLGKTITVTGFNLFFTLTFPITFLALAMFYLGILLISGKKLSARKEIFFLVWFAAATLFFAYFFITRGGVIDTYIMPLAGNILLYLPIRLLIIFAAIRLLFHAEIRSVCGIIGVAGVAGESILGLMRNLFVVKTVLVYPSSFWYVALSNSRFFFVTQAASIIFLAVGFYFLHKAYCRLRSGTAR